MAKHLISKRLTENDKLSVEELTQFMNFHGISIKELSEILGVTVQAVHLWVNGCREFSVTNSRLLKLFNRYPHLIKEF